MIVQFFFSLTKHHVLETSNNIRCWLISILWTKIPDREQDNLQIRENSKNAIKKCRVSLIYFLL